MECVGIAGRQIRAAGAADQQRVAGEHPVVEQEGIGIVGVARRIQHVEAQAFDLHTVAFIDPHGDDVGLGMLAHEPMVQTPPGLRSAIR